MRLSSRSNIGGANVLSWRVNDSKIAENDAISWLKAAKALVVAIREILGGGVGVGITVGVTST